jgi:hypothetical protein
MSGWPQQSDWHEWRLFAGRTHGLTLALPVEAVMARPTEFEGADANVRIPIVGSPIGTTLESA